MLDLLQQNKVNKVWAPKLHPSFHKEKSSCKNYLRMNWKFQRQKFNKNVTRVSPPLLIFFQKIKMLLGSTSSELFRAIVDLVFVADTNFLFSEHKNVRYRLLHTKFRQTQIDMIIFIKSVDGLFGTFLNFSVPTKLWWFFVLWRQK